MQYEVLLDENKEKTGLKWRRGEKMSRPSLHDIVKAVEKEFPELTLASFTVFGSIMNNSVTVKKITEEPAS